jgi:hypothetical protein
VYRRSQTRRYPGPSPVPSKSHGHEVVDIHQIALRPSSKCSFTCLIMWVVLHSSRSASNDLQQHITFVVATPKCRRTDPSCPALILTRNLFLPPAYCHIHNSSVEHNFCQATEPVCIPNLPTSLLEMSSWWDRDKARCAAYRVQSSMDILARYSAQTESISGEGATAPC